MLQVLDQCFVTIIERESGLRLGFELPLVADHLSFSLIQLGHSLTLILFFAFRNVTTIEFSTVLVQRCGLGIAIAIALESVSLRIGDCGRCLWDQRTKTIESFQDLYLVACLSRTEAPSDVPSSIVWLIVSSFNFLQLDF